MQLQHTAPSIVGEQQQADDYIMGRSEHERQRLIMQADILRGWTEDFFRAAGLAPGMRVLDIGCGMGDVSLLAAELVGPYGAVTGIDCDPVVVEHARQRTHAAGLANRVVFSVAEISEFVDKQPYDAVVGRYVLAHMPDPVAVVRHVSSLVRPGGLVVFHEPDLSTCVPMYPAAPLWENCFALLSDLLVTVGKPADIGKRLTRVFLDAGLTWPMVRATVAVGGGPGSYVYGWLAETLRSILPGLEQTGLATGGELQVDTLADRLEAEAVALGSQLMCGTQYGAWAVVGSPS